MRAEEHWDSHTQKIVSGRLETPSFFPCRFFEQHEADTLFALCRILLDDRRDSIMAYVVHHFDSTLHAGLGESQRKVGVPRLSALMRDGLALFDHACSEAHGGKFAALDDRERRQAVEQLMQGNLTLQNGQKTVPVAAFTDRILSEAVAAYYSHPEVWSEIGYAGPAYPRGYVRTELGLTDPWEARKHGD